MRSVFDFQACLDTVPISEIEIDPKSRDTISRFLSAMRQIFLDVSTREKLFHLLEQEYKPDTRKDRGRPGMLLGRVWFLAALKQALGCDYDMLAILANELKILRLMLGHGTEDWKRYTRQALHDNVSALSPELLQSVNQLVVEAGHRIVGQSEDALLRCSCDSKVVKSNIHFPYRSEPVTGFGRLRTSTVSQMGRRVWSCGLAGIQVVHPQGVSGRT